MDLQAFSPNYRCKPAPQRPNTTLSFQLVDSHQPLLNNSPSPFILPSWEALLSQYPGSLPVTLVGILKYGCQLGYKGPPQFILSQNLKLAHIDQSTISDKLILDLALRRVVSRTPSFPLYLTATLSPVNEDKFMEIVKVQIPNNHKFCGCTSRPNIAYSVVEHDVEQIEAVCQSVAEKLEQYPALVKIIMYSSSIKTIKKLGSEEALNCYTYCANVGSTIEEGLNPAAMGEPRWESDCS
jgi:hypothetical protein